MSRIMAMAVWTLGIALVVLSAQVDAYRNYTVGDTLGWYDNIQKPNVNYEMWAQGKNFSLGDYLIFNTDTNHTVVRTYNASTYKTCDYEDAEDDDTTEFSGGQPSAAAKPVTTAVPLVREGVNYFFSGDYDGWQCSTGGQKFQITVAHGQGLPPALLSPPLDSSSDNNSGEPESAPVTNIPSAVMTPVADSTHSDVTTDQNAAGILSLSLRVYSALGFFILPFLLTT